VITHGGPGLSTTTWVFKTYLSTFRYFDLGYGAATAFSLMLILIPFILLYLNLVVRGER
jgi:multiple sugar transport system permease protein